MKLTGNISIQSIIYVVRIDLLTPTSDVPNGTFEHDRKMDRCGPAALGPLMPTRFQRALEQILIFQTRTQDKDFCNLESHELF